MRTITILLFALIIASCGGDQKETKNDTTPVKVSVVKAQQADSHSFETSGTVIAENNATIKTRLGGFVDKIHVKIGDKVSKGQLLISINSIDLQAKLSQANSGIATAQVAYDIAKKDKERYEKLLKQQSISQKEFENITLQFQAAESQLKTAKEMATEVKANLNYMQIRAPFSGVISAKFIQKGDLASPGVPLLGIEGVTNYEVRTQIPSDKINSVKVNDEVNIHIKDLNKTFKGKVSEVSPSSMNNGSVFETKVQFIEETDDLKSGLFSTVSFTSEINSTSNKIYIPKSTLVYKGSLTGVYVLSNDTAFLRWIRIGADNGDMVEVLSGISANDSIILPNAQIENGTHVTTN